MGMRVISGDRGSAWRGHGHQCLSGLTSRAWLRVTGEALHDQVVDAADPFGAGLRLVGAVLSAGGAVVGLGDRRQNFETQFVYAGLDLGSGTGVLGAHLVACPDGEHGARDPHRGDEHPGFIREDLSDRARHARLHGRDDGCTSRWA